MNKKSLFFALVLSVVSSTSAYAEQKIQMIYGSLEVENAYRNNYNKSFNDAYRVICALKPEYEGVSARAFRNRNAKRAELSGKSRVIDAAIKGKIEGKAEAIKKAENGCNLDSDAIGKLISQSMEETTESSVYAQVGRESLKPTMPTGPSFNLGDIFKIGLLVAPMN